MTRRYTQPAPINGLTGFSYYVMSSPAPTQSPHGLLRRHALALAIMAVTGGFALVPDAALAQSVGCTTADSAGTIRFERPAGVPPGGIYEWPYPDPNPGTQDPFDSKNHRRVEVGNCQVAIGSTAVTTAEAITVDVNVTDIFGNGNQSSGGNQPADVWVGAVNLSNRVVTDPNARNVITIDGINNYGSVIGPDGAAPTTLNLNGMRISGIYNIQTGPADLIRNGDIINIRDNADLWANVYAGGGNDTINLEGGRTFGAGVYGDNRSGYDAATLANPANTFDDVFNITGGTWSIYGDSGSKDTSLVTYAKGNDVFNIIGGTISKIEGDGGNDTFDFQGPATVTNAFGEAGNDLFILRAGIDPTKIWNIAGDEGELTLPEGDGADTLRIYGVTLKASDRNNSGSTNPGQDVSIRAMNIIELLEGTKLTVQNDEPIATASSYRLGRFGDPEQDHLVIDATSWLIAGYGKYTTPFGPYTMLQTALNYSVYNSGTIDLGQDEPGTNMVIYGDYVGGGRVLMSAYLGDDSSFRDWLTLRGNVSGSTVLDIKPVAGSTGAQTVEGITVVDIDPAKTIAADAFVLTAPLTTENGLWQYRLTRNATTQDFVLTSSVPAPTPSPTPTLAPTPSPSPTSAPTPSPSPTSAPTPSPSPTSAPTPSPSPTSAPTPAPTTPPGDHLLHPRTSVYAMGMVTAQGLVMDSLGGVSDRASLIAGNGEIGHKDALWMRANYAQVDAGRGQFSADQQQFSLRAGKDLRGDSASRTGVTGVVARGVAEISDHVRPTIGGFATPLVAEVGEVLTTLVGVGGYHTWFFGPGGYVDVTGQVGRLWVSNSNIETTMSDANGWSAIASAEVGGQFALGNGGWSVTPQGQLVASHVRLGEIDDGIVRVDGNNMTAYRARVGLRLRKESMQGPRFYGLANIWRNLSSGAGTVLHGGTDMIVVAPQFARTWFEAGVGVAVPTSKAGSFAFDVRGQRGRGDDDRTSLGLQATWKLSW